MRHRTSLALRLLAALMMMNVLAAAAAEPPSSSSLGESQVFRQYNATIFQYQGGPRIADWQQLPFDGPVVQSLWCQAAAAFVLLTHDGSVYMADVDGLQFQKISTLSCSPSTRMTIRSDGASLSFVTVVSSSTVQLSVCSVLPDAFRSGLNCSTWTVAVPPSTKAVTQVNAVSFTKNGTLAVGTDAGLLFISVPALKSSSAVVVTRVPLFNTTGSMITSNAVTQLWCNQNTSSSDTCYVVTNDNYVTPNAWTTALVQMVVNGSFFYFHRTPGYIDAPPTAFVRDDGRGAIHMLNEQCDNILYDNGTFFRVEGYHGGLPQQNLTSGGAAVSGSGTIWMGSVRGAMMLRQDWTWKYFFGPRWLPGTSFTDGMNVSSISVGEARNGDDVTLVATDQGISFIRHISWSLQEKAAHYEAIRDARHNRHGLCTSVSLQTFGNISSWQEQQTANDGLWTSLYVGSQAFRYAATKDPRAKANAWQAFEGMQLLINVTGEMGYPARSAMRSTSDNGNCNAAGGWYPSPTMPGWCFWSDTSSDEIVGHLHVYPLVYDLVAELPWEKAAVARTIDNIMSYIVDNNFTLVDPVTGKETSWGRWGPVMLNDDPEWYDGRGPNSNEILTHLTNAYRITNNPKYASAFYSLVDHSHYDLNVVNLKITQPSDINYSDDELTYLPHLSFIFGDKLEWNKNASNPLFERAKQSVLLSITRTQWIVARGKSSLWNAIFSGVSHKLSGGASPVNEQFVRDGKWCLETWPIQLVDWPIRNRDRLDVIRNPHQKMSGDVFRLETLLPFDENPQLMWNGNPFRAEGGSGYQEVDPGPWLYPYWVGVYFGLWF